MRSPSLLVRVLAPQWRILSIWNLILSPLRVTLTIRWVLAKIPFHVEISNLGLSVMAHKALSEAFLGYKPLKPWTYNLLEPI